jgi:UDP-GlcNAc:undecaprenyl-phosphate GlcNAc-1-phosphate transferase
MNIYLGLFITAMCSALIMTPVVRRVAERFGWLDSPRDERRVHLKAVPRLGGVVIFLSVLVALAALTIFDDHTRRLIRANPIQLFVVLVPATLVFLCGLYDDLRGAHARLKLLWQGLAGVLLYSLGGRVEALSIPFIGSVELHWVVGLIVTVFWTVAITNAFNLIDGIDGLAAGAALFASLVISAVALLLGHPILASVALALSGALIGFLRYNFNPASIFLGDSGSLFIGFTLAALSVEETQKASTTLAVTIPLIAFGLPVIDTGLALIRRFISGRSLFQADREHIHHMLLARGWSQRRVAWVLYGVCALFSMLALFSANDMGRPTGLVLLAVGIAVMVAVGRLRYHEVDELRASFRRTVALPDRRLRAANNIVVRRASHAMSEATTLADLFAALRTLLELSVFAYATVELGTGVDAARNQWLLEREKGAASLHGVEVMDGVIRWSWERGDIEAVEIVASGHFWKLSLPLSGGRGAWGQMDLYRVSDSGALLLDINYLCSLFQREMAQAAARILDADNLEQPVERFAAAAN